MKPFKAARIITVAFLVATATGLAAQNTADSPGHITVDLGLGSETNFYQLRLDAFLNPGNLLKQDSADGNLYQTTNIQANYAFGLSLQVSSTLRWFNWNQDTASAELATKLAGGAPLSLDISEWKAEWNSADGLFAIGVGKQLWEPGPGRQLKAANYLGWIFNDNAKTMAWLGLTQDFGTIKFAWAPRAAWVPELFWSNNQQVADNSASLLPGGDIYLLQIQLFLGQTDWGLYAAYDGDFNTGLWFSLPITKDLIVYSEAAYSSKAWLPVLNGSTFNINYRYQTGLRAMAGMLYSPSFIDLSLYLESSWNSDAYTDADWHNLGSSLQTLDAMRAVNPAAYTGLWAGTHGNLAAAWRYGAMSLFNVGLHLKPNVLIANILDWSLSLNYGYPAQLYTRLWLELKPGDGISLQVTWDVPLALTNDSQAALATSWLYQQKLTISANLLGQTAFDFKQGGTP